MPELTKEELEDVQNIIAFAVRKNHDYPEPPFDTDKLNDLWAKIESITTQMQ